MSAHHLFTRAANVFRMGRRGRGISPSCESRLLVYRPRRTAASKPRPVLPADSLLLLALLEWRKAICHVGCARVGRWKRIQTGSDRISLTALADFHVAWNEVIPDDPYGGRTAGRCGPGVDSGNGYCHGRNLFVP